MREKKFRGKRLDNGEWVYGKTIVSFSDSKGIDNYIAPSDTKCLAYYDENRNIVGFKESNIYLVDNNTIGQDTGRKDINDINAHTNDIVKYKNHSGNECIGIIKFGEYEQDGSGGEFRARKCLGYYIERIKIFPLDWEKDDEVWDPDYYKTISILETEVEIIGNIHDNPELLEVKE